jgi:demethylsterigmatocystin 6-O-methyltransferase
MTASSTLLIDEVVIPEKGAHWMVMQRDLTMMALFNAAERSEMQWRALLQQAGLRIEEIQCYDERMAACMIVAKLI